MPYTEQFYDRIAQGCRSSANAVVPAVVELFDMITETEQPLSVVDVGCGEGHWLEAFQRHRHTSVLGIDGAHINLDRLAIDPVDFRAQDIAHERITIDGEADLVVSLEVGEHLPLRRAETYVEDLCGIADVVLFSAAIPKQGGAGHVNEQWPLYWVEKFGRHGYEATGALRWKFWSDHRVEIWYRQNLLVFARHTSEAYDRWPIFGGYGDEPIAVVHPQYWEERA